MNCYCQNCEGTGKVECDECFGRGEWESSIETAKFGRESEHYDELKALQDDAIRVNKDAERLKALVPYRSKSYEHQRLATIEVIEKEAEKLQKGVLTNAY